MENTTVLLGRILAAYLLVSGLGFLVSPKFYENQLSNSDKSDPLTVNLSGMVHFLIGIALLNIHFVWDSVLAILVTLLEFSFVAKGFSLIVIPSLTLKSSSTSGKYLWVSGVGFIVLGFVLGYLSYFA